MARVEIEHIIRKISGYWAAHLGCSSEAMFAQPLLMITHGAELADYDGIFALFRSGAAAVSFPSGRVGSLHHLLPAPPFMPARFADAFHRAGFIVVGPAWIGYAESVRSPSYAARSLSASDAPAAAALRAACTETEWEHGGSVIGEQPSSGVFVGGDLVALAGYEVWGGVIAHLAIITRPAFRGRGFGRSAVAHLARVALAARLIPQYRTLESNLPSMRIAESLGFLHYASSVAVRLSHTG